MSDGLGDMLRKQYEEQSADLMTKLGIKNDNDWGLYILILYLIFAIAIGIYFGVPTAIHIWEITQEFWWS